MATEKKERDKIGMILYGAYVLLLIASVVLVVRIIYLETIWKPDSDIEKRLSQQVSKTVLSPVRGNILADDGRLLAMSFPRYQVVMDPNIDLSEIKKARKDKKEDKVKKLTEGWDLRARELAQAIVTYCPDKSADEYYAQMVKARRAGKTYLRIGKPIEKAEYEALQACQAFKVGRYKGGVWSEKVPTRRYPFDRLAYRTIGFVRSDMAGVSNNLVGLDGKFNHVLHGEEGHFYTKATDEGHIRDYDSLYVAAIDGTDIRTTLNVDYQEIADRALRNNIALSEDIEGGCCVLMEVKTGAIKAMANLKKTKSGALDEVENFAIGRKGEPGSVFKITTLMTALEDGHIQSLDDKIPTNNSVIPGYNFQPDKHILEWERRDPVVTKDWGNRYDTRRVPICYGVQKSSNYVFRYIGTHYYGACPEKLIDRLYMYKLGESYDFDLDGLKTPSIPDPKSPGWSKYDLAQVAMGYTVGVTPLHILTFYNAIANKGRMMKPYLVEDLEKDGVVTQHRGPSVLNSSICSKATADTVTRALEYVTISGGTAWRLDKAKCKVVGKTGTAHVYLEAKNGFKGGYQTPEGLRKCQATFVGFFPAEDPQYSIICCMYSRLSKEDINGGRFPAQTVREVVDRIYDIDPYWNNATLSGNRK